MRGPAGGRAARWRTGVSRYWARRARGLVRAPVTIAYPRPRPCASDTADRQDRGPRSHRALSRGTTRGFQRAVGTEIFRARFFRPASRRRPAPANKPRRGAVACNLTIATFGSSRCAACGATAPWLGLEACSVDQRGTTECADGRACYVERSPMSTTGQTAGRTSRTCSRVPGGTSAAATISCTRYILGRAERRRCIASRAPTCCPKVLGPGIAQGRR
jgi:hypothetical protein